MQMVTEFHQTFDPQAIRDTPGMAEKKYFDFRINFLMEELDELIKASRENNVVEIADALGDIRYVLYGMALNFGYSFDILTDVLLVNYNMPMKYYVDVMAMCIDNMQRDYNGEELWFIAKDISDLDSVLTIAEAAAGLTDAMPAVIAEIHRSNMTKCCATEQEAIISVNQLYMNGTECYHVECNGKWVVRRKSDDKIQKPYGYQKPNLAKVLAAFISTTDPS